MVEFNSHSSRPFEFEYKIMTKKKKAHKQKKTHAKIILKLNQNTARDLSRSSLSLSPLETLNPSPLSLQYLFIKIFFCKRKTVKIEIKKISVN